MMPANLDGYNAVILKLETVTGRNPFEALSDACRIATLLGSWVCMNVNGIDTMIAPNDDPHALLANWRKALERGAGFASANVIPNPPKKEG